MARYIGAEYVHWKASVSKKQHQASMAPVVAACLTTVFSCGKSRKFAESTAYWKSSSATITRKPPA
jgi:hypothetical protein